MAWIALVGPEIEENLSLRYLASSLAKAGHRSEIVPFSSEHEFGAAVAAVLDADEPPLLVGVSLAFQWRAMDMMAYAMALRDGGYTGHITVGGHFATFAARELLGDFAEIDSVVRQEGEDTIVALANALRDGGPLGDIAGLAYRDGDEVKLSCMPSNPDLATLPWPDRRGEPAACFDHKIAPLVSSRGCYAHCTFCCIAAWHEQTLPGKRYRLRDPEAVADEMVAMQRERGIEIFVFHDDNFFVPGHKKNLERFNALADALQARGIGPFATVVKARPTDVDRAVFSVLVERLNAIRCYIGVETDSEQGLETLRRWSRPRQNHAAIEIVRELGLYVCFNMLMFDPDTTVDTLEVNLDFLEFAPDYPSNFGRVELYAGTPLLHRMKDENRVRGDYMQWDYNLHDPVIERVYQLTLGAFRERNFGPAALNNRIMGTRFDLEVCRHFHPELYDDAWRQEGVAITRELGLDSVRALREIVAHVKTTAPGAHDRRLVEDLAARLRHQEALFSERAIELAATLTRAIGHGRPLTEIGDRVATPLQRGVAELGWGS
jgi:anaerobic magnesium-protoporphyrin IX monomethyl ester cyclase